MIVPRALIPLVAAAMIAAGCSGSDGGASSASQASSSTSSGPSASPSPTSAFCLNLSTLQVGLLAYRGDAGRVLQGGELDLKELRRKAALIEKMAEQMESSIPPDIEKDFRTVLKAIEESSGNLKEGAKVRDVLDPLYGEKNAPAFEAMSKYECKPGS